MHAGIKPAVHDGIACIAGGNEDFDVGPAPARLVGELPAVHAAGKADNGEHQVDFRVRIEHAQGGGTRAGFKPALPILFVTGYADRAALEGVSEAQIIGKPFVDSELHEKLRTALARRPPGKVVRLRSC